MTETKRTKTIDEIARDERLAYYREWRAKNRDRVKKHNADYWRRRAARIQAESEGANDE